MSKVSHAQLTALYRIKFHGLNVWAGDPFTDGAMATLDAPPPTCETINIATVRNLIRQGWIGAVRNTEDEFGRDTMWAVTAAGNELLNQNRDHLARASHETAHIQKRALMREISIAQKPGRDAELREWANSIEWSESGLKHAGFQGFVRFTALPESNVPRGAGIYAVMRLSNTSVTFREQSIAGRFKGKPPSVDIRALENKWIPGAIVLYIGKAEVADGSNRGLAKRLNEYCRHGSGESIGHWGGRYIWQLQDSADLTVAWMEITLSRAEDVESVLLESFFNKFGALPFANLKRGRKLAT